MRRNIDQILIV